MYRKSIKLNYVYFMYTKYNIIILNYNKMEYLLNINWYYY